MSRVGDSITGPRLHSSYEYYKSIHERNEEALKVLFKKLDAVRPLKFYTKVFGKEHEVDVQSALSFALTEHVLKAILHWKEENPTMGLSIEEIKRKYYKDIISYIMENLAHEEHGYKVSGSLMIL